MIAPTTRHDDPNASQETCANRTLGRTLDLGEQDTGRSFHQFKFVTLIYVISFISQVHSTGSNERSQYVLLTSMKETNQKWIPVKRSYICWHYHELLWNQQQPRAQCLQSGIFYCIISILHPTLRRTFQSKISSSLTLSDLPISHHRSWLLKIAIIWIIIEHNSFMTVR